jgi:hypothetical protein
VERPPCLSSRDPVAPIDARNLAVAADQVGPAVVTDVHAITTHTIGESCEAGFLSTSGVFLQTLESAD